MKKRKPIQCGNEISPEQFPGDRLEAVFKAAGEDFKKTQLTMRDINKAVKEVRKNACRKSI